MSYPVFRKVFHAPRKWTELPQMRYLMDHSYAKENTQDTLKIITSLLKELGYMEDNNKMIHDYICYTVEDLLDKNGEVYITEDDIRESEPLKKLMGGMTPDFVVKKNGNRTKTIILDVYVGSAPDTEVKGKYKALAFFAEMSVVTQHNLSASLKCVLPQGDIDYLHKNFQLFLTEYFYWRACIKLRKVLLNDVQNVELQQIGAVSTEQQAARMKYKHDLASYASLVADQANI